MWTMESLGKNGHFVSFPLGTEESIPTTPLGSLSPVVTQTKELLELVVTSSLRSGYDVWTFGPETFK